MLLRFDVKNLIVMASIRPFFISAVLLFGFHFSVNGQGYTAWSVTGDLAVIMSKDDKFQAEDFLLSKSSNSLEYGVNVLARRFYNEMSPVSIEYGIGLNRSSYSLTLYSPDEPSREISIDQIGVSAPFRIFYGGKFTRNRNRRQSGLFVEAIPSGRFGSDILRPIFDGYLGLGARTRGRHVYLQIAFDWRIFTTKTYFAVDERQASFRDRTRRAALLTIGYQFP